VPTVSGQLQLQDYNAALVARGFDSYQPAELTQIINFGYRYIARKFPWAWEQSQQDYTVNPGDPPLLIQGGAPLSADSVINVDLVTDPYRRKLEPATEDYFRRRWQYQDLVAAKNRGTPARYYVYSGNLYLLPPPQFQVTARVFFHQYLADLVNPTDVPVMPQIYDEVILEAALVRAHRRAHELELAQEVQVRVDEAVSDLLQDDVWNMEELQERVLPDNQWL
jgi:hypothetical protein